jgi:thiazole/oxazole-forming peptide maturase SagD family component
MQLRGLTHVGTVYGSTRTLMKRMVSPLCGINQSAGFVTHGRAEPRFVIAGAELTGVHHLLGYEQPMSYHIGGSGVFLEEALIRTLGETVERYAQLVTCLSGRHELRFASLEELTRAGERALEADRLRLFSDAQLASQKFPFKPFSPTAKITWVRGTSLLDGAGVWLPAQAVFVGYRIRSEEGEERFAPAFTTGSAAHTDPQRALRNTLLELVQLDAAMGHWYSGGTAPRILLDERTKTIEAIAQRYIGPSGLPLRWHWLPAPSFRAMNVACVVGEKGRRASSCLVGLGSDTALVDAMYKALLEAVGVFQLGKLIQVAPSVAGVRVTRGPVDASTIFDLDSNVAYYARPEPAGRIDRSFPPAESVRASELPRDMEGSVEEQIRELIADYRQSRTELVLLDCTTEDIRQLGFVAPRAWSPDLISLCLPSAPPLAHARFAAYGGASHVDPHPYP